MKITIVHQYFRHPREGGAIRSYYLAQGLLEQGHEVEVITAHNEKQLEIRRIDGIKVFYLPVYYDNALDKYQRMMAFAKFVFQAIALFGRIKKPNFLYVISTPLTVGIIALWLKLTKRIRYIFEIGDLWPDAPIQLGYLKNPLLKRALYVLEKLVYNHAHRIVAMSPDIERIIDIGEKVLMIPNMADCEFFTTAEKSQELLEEYGFEDQFVIAYLGAAGRANHLEYLLEAAKIFQKEQLPVKILVAAAGNELEHFRASVFDANLENIVFDPYTNKKGVRKMLSLTDAVYVSFAKVPILSSGSPNKFFDGLAAGKIIIVNFEGWVNDEIESAECGFSYQPDNPKELIEKIKPYLFDSELRVSTQLNARKLAEQKFSRKELIEKWLKVFE